MHKLVIPPLILAALWLGVVSVIPAQADVSCRAKTCSQALLGCYRKCPKPGSDRCNTFCPTEYQNCLRTGDFNGHFCTDRGLIRK